ncbi:uncharacterized protein DSM5745_02333 [Aspergillus mulundensis]|uniref:HNH nuclease domain-containing protein n=1 Tax=Aspergillus mulundensis TaxID=1810919 RepID=A0A3D8SXQ9_9EURO|nr:hypothetical protein DSM5745_02333 [Aspergillus mulundensis]RDW90558.1 hypothetical protein DSM5745_02333 [Aspergillus mulundensis]
MSAPRAWETPVTFRPRNVHIFAGNGDYLGGLFLNNPPRITNARFQTYCARFIVFAQGSQWRLYVLGGDNQAQSMVLRNSSAMRRGRYVILGPERQQIPVTLRTDPAQRRVPTNQPPTSRLRGNQRHFRRAVLARDGRCAITGAEGPPERPNRGLVAAHIYPVARQNEWARNNLQQAWLTDTSPAQSISPNGLFSAQNGLLLSSGYLHESFDSFDVGIDPDDNYRVVVFNTDRMNLGGRSLNARTRQGNVNHRVSDHCLRWHFQQCILTHMRGAGEPIWDLFDDDYEDTNAIMEHEDAAELMEAQLATRLGAFIEVS